MDILVTSFAIIVAISGFLAILANDIKDSKKAQSAHVNVTTNSDK